MNKDNQKIIEDICPLYKEYGTCEQCNAALDIDEDDAPCYWECMANCIVRNNYRKASEVAKEIGDEIAKHLMKVTAIPNYVAIEASTLISIFAKYKEGKE